MILNFGWILPGRLAGFGLSGELTEADVGTLERAGVGALVTLTEQAVWPEPPDLRWLHLPVRDMTVPEPEQVDRFLEFVTAAEDDGLAAAVHCRAGLGRFLAAPSAALAAEDLRLAARALGRITGRVGVEDMLDIIFRDFCIGK